MIAYSTLRTDYDYTLTTYIDRSLDSGPQKEMNDCSVLDLCWSLLVVQSLIRVLHLSHVYQFV